MIYILTNTDDLLEIDVKALECRQGDEVAEATLSLSLKQNISNLSFNEQEIYLKNAAIASYVSLNKLDQRQRFRASINLTSLEKTSFDFSKGSSSSGLGYALAIFESWWIHALNKPSKYSLPVFATGEILTSGTLNPVGYIKQKVDSVITYASNRKNEINGFYLCIPKQNFDDISQKQFAELKKLGCILISSTNLQGVLGAILTDSYDGDPLGRWEPFKGLSNFEYEDSVRFFGRDKDVKRLYDDLNQNKGLLIVSGASGTGKSSLIKAGLIPYIEKETADFYWCSTTPSQLRNSSNVLKFLFKHLAITYKFNDSDINLNQALSSNNVAKTLVDLLASFIKVNPKIFLLYVDQYEESFSHNELNDIDNALYLEVLNEISNEFDNIKIVIALRNEYLGKILENQALSSPVISNISSQLPIASWEAIVYEQAQFSGISFEVNSDGLQLNNIIIDEAAKTQFALPMVGFLLEQLYLKSASGTLSFNDYENIGGLNGAIAYRAKIVLKQHHADDSLVDSFFEAFVGLNSESLPYSRHVNLDEIHSQDVKLYQLVLSFIDANLINYSSGNKDNGALKFSHDSLFSNWIKLKEWVESYKDYLNWRSSVDGLYNRWLVEKENKKYLLKDKRLIKEGLIYIKKKTLKSFSLKKYINTSRSKNTLFNINIVVFLFLIPSLIGGYFYWDHNSLKIYTYEEIGKRWEVPYGINEIDIAQIAKKNYHYSLIYQGRELMKVKKLNSAGNLYGEGIKDNVAIWEYSYSDNGKLSSIVEKTRSEKNALINYYRFSSNKSAVLTFSKDINKVGFSAGSSRDPFNLRPLEGKSKVSRKLLKFYQNGLLKQISYQDPYGRNITHFKDEYGFLYEYDNQGLIKNKTTLGTNLQALINTKVTFQYDSNNRKNAENLGGEFVDAVKKIDRDVFGNIIARSLFYNQEKTVNQGEHKIVYKYDKNGFLIEELKLGLEDELVMQSIGQPSKIKYKYYLNGNLEEVFYYGKDDHLMIHHVDGYAIGKFKFNAKNQVIETSSFGLLEEPILRKTPRISGVFKNKINYDLRGNRINESYFGLEGEPVISSGGYHRLESKFDQYDQMIEQRMYGIDNTPSLGKLGVFLRKFEYDPQGNMIKASDFGLEEEPIINLQGFHSAANKHDEKGNIIEEATYNTQDSLMLTRDGMAMSRMAYDDFGNVIETSFFDQFEAPTLVDGIHKAVTNFGGGASIGRISGFEYYGINGEPVLNDVGVHKTVSEYNSNGKALFIADYGINNELVIKKGGTRTSSRIGYYPRGKKKTEKHYRKDGSYTMLKLDEAGNITSYSFFDKNDRAILGKGIESSFSKSLTEFDEFGNPIQMIFLDENGNSATNSHGYSTVIYLKDKNGVLTHKAKAFDINGNPVLSSFPVRVIKIQDKKEDKSLWEYIKSVNTKEAFQLYLNLVRNGTYKKVAQNELLAFTSKVHIKSETKGGKILLNGQYMGYEKIDIDLKPGKYKFRIKKRGYISYYKEFDIQEGKEVSLSIKLKRDSSVLGIDALILKANKGDAEAQKNLGNKYLDEGKNEEALSWYLKSSSQGYLPAIHNMGYLYETGKGVKKDLHEAFNWYLKAANMGLSISERKLGFTFRRGDLVEKNIIKSLEYFRKAASKGDEYSQYTLGQHYLFNRKVLNRPSTDVIKAYNYFKLASQQGETAAYRYLGLIYAGSLITDFDRDKVIYWYEKAFYEGNDLLAALLLGELYLNEEMTAIDIEKAIFWFKKAAEEADEKKDKTNLLSASNSLYVIYMEGTTFFKNWEKGIYWLSISAKLGDAQAIESLKLIRSGGDYLNRHK